MSNLRDAAQQVLETWDADDWFDADTLRAALAQPEPAGPEDMAVYAAIAANYKAAPTVVEPARRVQKQFMDEEVFYATPPRAALTDEQIRDLWSWSATHEAERTATTQQHAFARAIEAAHGIGGPRNE